MNTLQAKTGLSLTLLFCFASLNACGPSERETEYLLDEAYEQGYWGALDCVKRKGGRAEDAAYDCKDE